MLLFNVTWIMPPKPGMVISLKNMKNKIQITQNKYMRHYLQYDKRIHVLKNKFKNLNWLPFKDRFSQSVKSVVFKYFTNKSLLFCYWDEFSKPDCLNNLRTRNSYLKLVYPFRKANTG